MHNSIPQLVKCEKFLCDITEYTCISTQRLLFLFHIKLIKITQK